jgi:hypothetical protein
MKELLKREGVVKFICNKKTDFSKKTLDFQEWTEYKQGFYQGQTKGGKMHGRGIFIVPDKLI